jgi:hypothetical protein
MKYIYYVAERGTILDKAIAKIDGSPYSHVELVLGETEDYWRTIACRYDSNVRLNLIRKDTAQWHVQETSRPLHTLEDFTHYLDFPYAVHKLPRTKCSWWPTFGKGFVCSSFLATIHGYEDPESFGVFDFLTKTLQEEANEH